jgi:hypothetical protein
MYVLFIKMNRRHADALKLYSYDKSKKCHLGVNRDGGYVIADIGSDYDCYISAGVSYEESFTRDIINKYNFKKEMCYAFDGTINDYPYQYTSEIQFIKKNIGDIESETITNLHNLIHNYNNIFLKMDIEGGEYDWIPSLSTNQMNKFKQIVIEIHGINEDGGEWPVSYDKKCEILEKLADTHYIVHAHGNNFGRFTDNIPNTIELTYLRKNLFDIEPSLNKEHLPIDGLDFTNDMNSSEINMNGYPFVN